MMLNIKNNTTVYYYIPNRVKAIKKCKYPSDYFKPFTKEWGFLVAPQLFPDDDRRKLQEELKEYLAPDYPFI